MSSNLFPSLPGLDVKVSREPRYSTQVYESVSGREVRVSWRTQPRIRYTLRFNFARTYTQAPAPYTSYSEMGVLLSFLDTHLGSFDSFLYADPYTGSQVRVRLVEDSLKMTQVVSGIWAVEQLQMETVL
ncbi:MAG: hypothetical protein RJA59_1506 [Pseudomonadota bacterium]